MRVRPSRLLRFLPPCAAALVGAALLAGCAADATPERIVLVVVDTLRRDHVSVYGTRAATPNVERLAARGVVHPHAAASFHQTSMSMASLFTGRTPAIESGDPGRPLPWKGRAIYGLARLFAGGEGETHLPPSVPTLAETLREAGYWTAGVTSNYLLFRPAGFDRGFDYWEEVGEPPQPRLRDLRDGGALRAGAELRAGEHVLAAVDRALAARPHDRLFLYVHLMDAHDAAPLGRSYAASVETADRHLGSLLDRLEAESLLDGALVVFTSDHGESLGEEHLLKGLPSHAGNPSFETLLQVPLVVAGAPAPPADALLRGDDVFRLIVRSAGRPAPAADLEPGEEYVGEALYRTYRRGRWKSFWRRTDGAFALVDLERDPDERTDVAARHPDVAAEHRARVEALTRKLAASSVPGEEVDPRLLERLRLLGYIDTPGP